MIRHIKYLIVFLFMISFSCKQEKVINGNIDETKQAPVEKEKQPDKNYTFYRSFASCNSDVGYFSNKEATEIYAKKIISINPKEIEKQNVSQDRFSDEDVLCLRKNLNLNSAEIGYVKTNDRFPFDTLLVINNKYIVVFRDAQFFIFTENTDNGVAERATRSKTISKEFDVIFNKNLVGLSVSNTNEKNYIKKYIIDSSSYCMCNSPSIFIDKHNSEIILFNYCDVTKKLEEIDNKHILKILKIEMDGETLVISTESLLKFNFTKKEAQLFQLQIEGKLPNDHIGDDLKNIFTTQPEKFHKEDCGDFEG